MTTIAFDSAVADHEDFNTYHLKNSREGRRLLVTGVAICLVLGILLALLLSFVAGEVFSLTHALLYGAGCATIYVPTIFWSTRRQVRRTLSKGRPNSSVGRRELSIRGEALVEIHESGEISTNLNAIEKIGESKRNFFVYISPLQAHIIPKKFDEIEGLSDFLSELQTRVKNAE